MKKMFALLCVCVLCAYSFCVSAMAADFDWKSCSGQTLNIMLNEHPYARALIEKIPEFEKLTGIKVDFTVTPEENYFDKLTTQLNSRTGEPDVYMTGAYQIWSYAPGGYVQELDSLMKEYGVPADYNFDDFFGGVVASLKWDAVPGHPVGTGSLWALPLGFETNFLSYNKKAFEAKGIDVPETMDDLIAASKKLQGFDGTGTYGVALRGTRNWATIHPGYMTTYANYGAKDFEVEDGHLVSKVNSPEAVEMTDKWVKLIQEGGSPTWANYTWYQAGADLGAGKAAILFDASCNGYFQSPVGASKEADNMAYAKPPVASKEFSGTIKANLWTWSIAINGYSKKKQAAWLFMLYFTSPDYLLWAATEAKIPTVDTPRKSVFNSDAFKKRVGARVPSYLKAFADTVEGTMIYFTPQPYFFETTTAWAATLQDLVAGKYKTTQEGMDVLKQKLDAMVEDIEVE